MSLTIVDLTPAIWKLQEFLRKGGDTMPRGDGTGPMGMGPIRGRYRGCEKPLGCRWGSGGGFRRMFGAVGLPWWECFRAPHAYGAPLASKADEKEFLKRQVRFLEKQLDDVRKRLDELQEKTR